MHLIGLTLQRNADSKMVNESFEIWWWTVESELEFINVNMILDQIHMAISIKYDNNNSRDEKKL